MIFELRPERKYNISCPKCGEFRNKEGTKTLTVYRDSDGYIRWQCSHANQCEWNERQYMKDPNPEEVLGAESLTVVPVRVKVELPTRFEGNRVWWIQNVDGEVLYGVVRIDIGKRKILFPAAIDEDGNMSKLPHWPEGKVLYGAEKLKDRTKVMIVEGEKTAEAAQLLFPQVAVVTWRGGASNVSTGDWDLLKDKEKIYLWPDNDDPGRHAMETIITLLDHPACYLVDTRSFPEKADLADNLDMETVRSLIKSAVRVSSIPQLESTMEEIEEQGKLLANVFKTGWKGFDDYVRMPVSGVVVIEGRTGHGKTASAISLAANHLSRGGSVAYFSFEIPAVRVFNRFSGAINDSSGQRIRDYVSSGKLKIYDQGKQITLSTMKRILSYIEKDTLVVIDYAQIVPTDKVMEMRAKMIELMDTLRIDANKKGYLVLLLSQLTPHYENPLWDAPRDAKDIHNSAETVLRVWYKDSGSSPPHKLYDNFMGNYIMHVIKNREGQGGHILGFSFSDGVRLEPVEDVA